MPDGCLLVQAGKQLERLTGGHVLAGFHEVCTRTCLSYGTSVFALFCSSLFLAMRSRTIRTSGTLQQTTVSLFLYTYSVSSSTQIMKTRAERYVARHQKGTGQERIHLDA